MKLSKREIIFLSILVIIVFPYLIYSLLYKPLLLDIDRMREANAELESIRVLTEEEIAGNTEIELAKKIEKFIKLNKRIPEDSYIPETIQLLDNISRVNKVDFLQIEYDENNNPLKMNDDFAYEENCFQIKVNGPYGNLVKFISSLEKTERFYRIESINMDLGRQQEKTDGDDTIYNQDYITMTIIFKSYFDNNSLPDIKGVKILPNTKTSSPNPFESW